MKFVKHPTIRYFTFARQEDRNVGLILIRPVRCL